MCERKDDSLQTPWPSEPVGKGVFSYVYVELHFRSGFFFTLGLVSKKVCLIFLHEAQSSYGNVRFT